MTSEVRIDLDGKKFEKQEKALIPEDVYDAIIVEFSSFEGKAWKSEETEFKIVASFRVEPDSGDPVVLPMFFSPSITKKAEGSSYDNSKLYSFLEKAMELEPLRNRVSTEPIETIEQLVDYLNTSLKGRSCKVLVETANKGKEDKAYSVVKKAISFSPTKNK